MASGGADAPIADPDLPQHWMREIYFSSLCLESRENEEGLGRLQVRLLSVVRQNQLETAELRFQVRKH